MFQIIIRYEYSYRHGRQFLLKYNMKIYVGRVMLKCIKVENLHLNVQDPKILFSR